VLEIRIEGVRPGKRVRVHGKLTCRVVRHRLRRGGCTAYPYAATLLRRIKAGPGRVALSGRVGRRALAPGAYRLVLTAHDRALNVSRSVRVGFTVLRG
jgi:hypothetical protein